MTASCGGPAVPVPAIRTGGELLVKTSVEPVEEFKVRIRLEVEPDEFEKEVDHAARHFAGELKIPGFRKGKAPRQVIEAHVGPGALREEALNHALPKYLTEAIDAEGLDVIAAPEIEKVDASEGTPLVVEALLGLRPEIEAPDFESFEVTVASPEVGEDEIDQQIDAMRRGLAPVETVSRPAADGDFVLIDLRGYQHDEEIPGSVLTDFLYEVGSATIVPELDEELAGKRSGDILKFNAVLPEQFAESAGEEAAFSVIVKEVRERRLPELTDDWVDENSEFDTVAELRADTRRRLEILKNLQSGSEARHQLMKLLAESVKLELPEALIDDEVRHFANSLAARLAANKMTFNDFLAATGQTEADVRGEWRGVADENVRSELALRAIAKAEGIEPSEEDRIAQVARIAQTSGKEPQEVAAALARGGGWAAMDADIIKMKALEVVLGRADVRDESGDKVDLTNVAGSGPAGGDIDIATGEGDVTEDKAAGDADSGAVSEAGAESGDSSADTGAEG